MIKKYFNFSLESNSIIVKNTFLEQAHFLFANFNDATGFVLKVGFTAEKLDHHPDILLHSWNNVKINISTHSKNAITFKDFELAQIIEKISLSS